MKYKTKNILIWIAIALIFTIALSVFTINLFDIEINIIKHHEMSFEGLTLKFYGDLESSKILKIYDGTIRRATANIYIDPILFEEINLFLPYSDDLNGDGHPDILIPHSKDSNNDYRYSALIWDNSISMYIMEPALTDISNVTVDLSNETITSTMYTHTVIAPEEKNIPEVYENRNELTEYKNIDGSFVAFREVALTYYSETDIYCYSIYNYDSETGGLVYTDEKWLTPEKAQNITLS